MSGCSEATRLLSCAVYEDDKLREKTIGSVVYNKHRAIAPCYGLDLIEVLAHCYESRRRNLRRDILISLCSIATVAGLAVYDSIWLVLLGCLMAWGILTYNRLSIVKHIFLPKLSRQNFKSDAQHELRMPLSDELARYIMESQNGNVVIYGGFSPFIGSGTDMGGWSFVIDVKKGAKSFEETVEPQPFDVEDLYDHMTLTLSTLEQQRVSVEDKLFASGKDIQNDKRFLDNPFARPITHVDPRMIRAFIGHPDQKIRVYKCLRITDWNGELIISMFLRFAKTDQYLFIETSKFLLTPIHNKYRGVDSLARLELRDIATIASESVLPSLIYLIVSPFKVLNRIIQEGASMRTERETREAIRKNPCFNYGAELSPREQAASPVYIHYFQKLDKEMYIKIIERTILNGIIGFLDERKIDTSEFKERENTILNAGVIVSGGSIQAESLAVGEGAQATATRATSRMQNIGTQIAAEAQRRTQR